MTHSILKSLGSAAALALGVLASGCGGNMTVNGNDGVPLAELDRGGTAPDELVLAGPDRISVVAGSALDIAVSGDRAAVDALRFSIEDGALAIGRVKNAGKNIGTAVVRVTLPDLRAIVVAGTGSVDAPALTGDASVTIAGSGSARVRAVATDTLDLTIAGSGEFAGSGMSDALDLTVAGSGSGRMAGLRVGAADVSIMGSGSAEFASDGRVEANIMGSGSVTVTGDADCSISKMGSGQLVCRGRTVATGAATPTAAASPAAD